ncbi:MAG: hypothetical protein LBF25_00750 [Puniceicoccales bacterium]|jgi:exopolyphosphatase/guanosine-5'-triphosphate,3'-diphosphate pyrophosphatase|nr:hypothetical protein [Puniceicoccales bacterium]
MQNSINIIDIGTGSIKASLFSCEGEACQQAAFRSIDIRMVDQASKEISSDKQNLAVEAIKSLISFGREKGTKDVICIATYGVRSAKNGGKFLAKVKAETGIDICLLTGFQEARFICDSVRNTEETENFWSMDLGGGSVEFNIFNGIHIFSMSKSIGAISIANILHSKQLNPSLENVTKIVHENTGNIPFPAQDTEIICTGGCISIAKQFLTTSEKIVSVGKLKALFEKVSPMSAEERLAFGIPQGRVDIFAIGLAIPIAVLTLLKCEKITISTANVRHGVALSRALFMR